MNWKFWGVPMLLGFGLASAHAQSVAIDSFTRIFDYSQNPNAFYDEHSVTNTTLSTILTPTTRSSGGTFGPGSASGYSTGSMGIMHAYATAAFPHVVAGGFAENRETITDSDSLAVTSPTLATGTIVTVDFNFVMDGTVSLSFAQQSEAPGALSGSGFEALTATPLVGGSQLMLSYQAFNSGTYSVSGSATVAVGSSITLVYEFQVDTLVDAANDSPYHSLTADFSNTAQLYANAADPNVVLTSASGYNYAAVPEPSSMVALSLAALGLVRRRKA